MVDLPAIPASCAHRPTVGGLVAPVVNLRLADGGVDFRSPHQATYERCWRERLCQVCGRDAGHPAVLFGGPNQLRDGRFDEPPLCAACAVYASQACPMVAGRQAHYADRARLAEGKRGKTCLDPACGCGGWIDADPAAGGSDGDPAHDWYAVYVRPTGYRLTAHKAIVRCSDMGCEHERVLIDGGRLTAPPLKIMLVSTQAEGRVWRRANDITVGGM